MTAEEIAHHYTACLHSVAILEATKPSGITEAEWAEKIARNRAHLQIMLAKGFWTDAQDMTVISDALAT